MGHNELKITEDVYINLQEQVYDCDKEIDAFIAGLFLEKTPVLDIVINEKYLLAVLPQKRYNIKDYAMLAKCVYLCMVLRSRKK